MAKKTRKQKRAADRRRKLDATYSLPPVSTKTKSQSVQEVSHKTTNATFLVYRDLQKTFMISILILAIEFVMFWIIEKDGWKYLEMFVK